MIISQNCVWINKTYVHYFIVCEHTNTKTISSKTKKSDKWAHVKINLVKTEIFNKDQDIMGEEILQKNVSFART